MGKNDGLDEFIDFLEDVQSTLAGPQPFFTAHQARYEEIARRVGVHTLNAMRPANADADLWRENSGEFAELIFSRPLLPGLEIVFAGRTEFDRLASRSRGQNPRNFTPISYEDVLEWVQAGVENGGKDLSAIELTRQRTPYQIAYDVHQAIKQHRLGTEKTDYSRITRRLEEWVDSRVLAGDMDRILEAVLLAWESALFPIVSRDFTDWITYDVLGV